MSFKNKNKTFYLFICIDVNVKNLYISPHSEKNKVFRDLNQVFSVSILR